jgi:hypothetical protein
MKRLHGLEPLAGALALLGGALLVLWALVSQGVTEVIVSPPEAVVEQLVRAMGAHRYEGALLGLSQDLRQQVHEEDLREIEGAIEHAHQGIWMVQGEQPLQQGERASAVASVHFDDGQDQSITLRLQKEQGNWKVSTIDPLRQLTQ